MNSERRHLSGPRKTLVAKIGGIYIKDWTGNATSVYANHGASNHSERERAWLDYYATDPRAVKKLLQKEKFAHYIWEPACGEGHISEVLKKNGYDVKSSDLVDRGYPGTQTSNFLETSEQDVREDFPRDIITNPPYKYAKEFVEHALDISMDSTKVAMFLKLTFLESEKRLKLFEKYPPKKIYVFSKRVSCALNGDFEHMDSSAVCYAWFVWEKGYTGHPAIHWI